MPCLHRVESETDVRFSHFIPFVTLFSMCGIMALAMAYKGLPAGGSDDGGAPVSDGAFGHVT